jgi:hypothetical protein
MWEDIAVNQDVRGPVQYRLPMPASPCYLLLTKGNPGRPGLTTDESSFFKTFQAQNRHLAPALPDSWFPTEGARALLLYYLPWRGTHHDTTHGDFLTPWVGQPLSVKNGTMVSVTGMVGADPMGGCPLAPIPLQDLELVKKGLDTYRHALLGQGVDVDATNTDEEYVWIGYWNDAEVEAALGTQVATMCVVNNGGKRGGKQAAQSAYYLWSQVRNVVLYPPEPRWGVASTGWMASTGSTFWRRIARSNGGPAGKSSGPPRSSPRVTGTAPP